MTATWLYQHSPCNLNLAMGNTVGCVVPLQKYTVTHFDLLFTSFSILPTQFGDKAEILYYAGTNFPKSLDSIDCEQSASDLLMAGGGLVDYLIGGGFDDELHGEEGSDLAFGKFDVCIGWPCSSSAFSQDCFI